MERQTTASHSKAVLITPSASPPSYPTFLPAPRSSRSRSNSPTKWPRSSSALSSFSGSSSAGQSSIDRVRDESAHRLVSFWSQLAERYSRRIDEDDIVDLISGKVIKDRGILRGMDSKWEFGHLDRSYPSASSEYVNDGGEEDRHGGELEEESEDELDSFAHLDREKREASEAQEDEAFTDECAASEELEEGNTLPVLPEIRALDPNDAVDAADLEEFLEAERLRKETCGSEGDVEDDFGYISEGVRTDMSSTPGYTTELSDNGNGVSDPEEETPTGGSASDDELELRADSSVPLEEDESADDVGSPSDTFTSRKGLRVKTKASSSRLADSNVTVRGMPLSSPTKPPKPHRKKSPSSRSSPAFVRQLHTPPHSRTPGLSPLEANDDRTGEYFDCVMPLSSSRPSSPLPPSSPPAGYYSGVRDDDEDLLPTPGPSSPPHRSSPKPLQRSRNSSSSTKHSKGNAKKSSWSSLHSDDDLPISSFVTTTHQTSIPSVKSSRSAKTQSLSRSSSIPLLDLAKIPIPENHHRTKIMTTDSTRARTPRSISLSKEDSRTPLVEPSGRSSLAATNTSSSRPAHASSSVVEHSQPRSRSRGASVAKSVHPPLTDNRMIQTKQSHSAKSKGKRREVIELDSDSEDELECHPPVSKQRRAATTEFDGVELPAPAGNLKRKRKDSSSDVEVPKDNRKPTTTSPLNASPTKRGRVGSSSSSTERLTRSTSTNKSLTSTQSEQSDTEDSSHKIEEFRFESAPVSKHGKQKSTMRARSVGPRHTDVERSESPKPPVSPVHRKRRGQSYMEPALPFGDHDNLPTYQHPPPPPTYDPSQTFDHSNPHPYPPIPMLDLRAQYIISNAMHQLSALFSDPWVPPHNGDAPDRYSHSRSRSNTHHPFFPHIPPAIPPYSSQDHNSYSSPSVSVPPRLRASSVSAHSTPTHRPHPYPHSYDPNFSRGTLPPSSPDPELESSPSFPEGSSPLHTTEHRSSSLRRASSLVGRSRSRGRRVSFKEEVAHIGANSADERPLSRHTNVQLSREISVEESDHSETEMIVSPNRDDDSRTGRGRERLGNARARSVTRQRVDRDEELESESESPSNRGRTYKRGQTPGPSSAVGTARNDSKSSNKGSRRRAT